MCLSMLVLKLLQVLVILLAFGLAMWYRSGLQKSLGCDWAMMFLWELVICSACWLADLEGNETNLHLCRVIKELKPQSDRNLDQPFS